MNAAALAHGPRLSSNIEVGSHLQVQVRDVSRDAGNPHVAIGSRPNLTEYSPGPLKITIPNQLLTPGTSDHRRHTYMTVLTSLIELGILFVWL